jgi:hypothetical protein
MDVFVERVRELDAAWQPVAAAAASGVTLSLGGEPVEVGADGGFTLPASAAGGVLEAVDGAGGRTSVAVPLPEAAAGRRAGRTRVLRRARRVRGRLRVRVVLVCRARCAGVVRVRSGRRVLGRRSVRLRAPGRRAIVVRMRPRSRPLPRRARVTFPGARALRVKLR